MVHYPYREGRMDNGKILHGSACMTEAVRSNTVKRALGGWRSTTGLIMSELGGNGDGSLDVPY
jgi:hypothetical protein